MTTHEEDLEEGWVYGGRNCPFHIPADDPAAKDYAWSWVDRSIPWCYKRGATRGLPWAVRKGSAIHQEIQRLEREHAPSPEALERFLAMRRDPGKESEESASSELNAMRRLVNLFAKISAMNAANQQLAIEGEPPLYLEEDFLKLEDGATG